MDSTCISPSCRLVADWMFRCHHDLSFRLHMREHRGKVRAEEHHGHSGDFPANDTVTHLTVSRTSLTRVAPRFENLRELRTVDLNTNQIDEIAEGAFRNLSKLESLVLRRNNISVVTSVTFLACQAFGTWTLATTSSCSWLLTASRS
ncbi:hypothetical protein C0Q70_21454 [Pomacea canaliculata]|uniref:LRRNT domain-containing protein n=1 Tax=Pomacea canaliculata TaxID=400727 RepID=A0A2T7NCJ6_POMCA|nr:hypothetical protein C0Q70_21454 [Pomacea canaliculata]